MAFNSNEGRQEFTASASQEDFVFNFKIFNTSDIKVYQTPSGQNASDDDDILMETTDYTVVIDGDNGGTVSLVVGAGNQDSITLIRDLPITRSYDYQQSGDFYADVVDEDQDYQTYLVADRALAESRAVTLPESAQGVSTELPTPQSEYYLRWNTEATALENDPSIPGSILLAKQWANEDEDIIVEDGEYSSKHYSIKASASAVLAQTYAESIDPDTLIPSGIITMWSGTIATIPSGWFLCDGANGTPDLRDKFVYGASIEADVNVTGGSADAVVVSHTHTGSTNTTGNHNHSFTHHAETSLSAGTNSYARTNGVSSISNSTANNSISSAGNHSHTVTINSSGESGTDKNLPPYMKLAYLMKG